MNTTKEIRVYVKHINSQESRKRAKASGKLKEFNVLDVQWKGRPKEGWYIIDTSHVFDNQYNAVPADEAERGKGKGFRLFELSCMLTTRYSGGCRVLDTGYYISEGIDEIRAFQKTVYKCQYCGKQYTKEEALGVHWCGKCLDSEYLEEKDLHLLKLKCILDEDANKVKVPKYIREKYMVVQKKKARERLKEDIRREKEALRKKREEIRTEEKALNWLINKGLFSLNKNVIYYSHLNEFCFGWRDSIKDKSDLRTKLKGFPFSYTIK